MFLESSAKDNLNISEIFTQLGHSIKRNLGQTETKPGKKIKIKDHSEAAGSGGKKNCEC